LPYVPRLLGDGDITKAEMCGFVCHGYFYYGLIWKAFAKKPVVLKSPIDRL